MLKEKRHFNALGAHAERERKLQTRVMLAFLPFSDILTEMSQAWI